MPIAPGKTKYEAAVHLAEIFPVLSNRLPRKRKTWTPEEGRMNVFDAVGLAAALVMPRPRISLSVPTYRVMVDGTMTRPFSGEAVKLGP